MDQIVRKDRPEVDDLDPHYRWDRHLPAWGTMGVDFESRVEFDRMRRYRIARARQALENSDLIWSLRKGDVRLEVRKIRK